jgi:predicted nuclease of predicted toxin-antitoxin system
MKFLLDYHISPRVAPAFKRMAGKSEVTHMRDWHGGAYVRQHGGSDLPWLRAAGREGWIIVTGDCNTLLGELAILYGEGGELPGFAVVGSEHLADIAWIARRLFELEDRLAKQRPPNVQVFL